MKTWSGWSKRKRKMEELSPTALDDGVSSSVIALGEKREDPED
jgi:hypothetical protein